MNLHLAYKILDLQYGVDLAKVKRQYQDLATIWHPDHHRDNERRHKLAQEKMKEINGAYNCIRSYFNSTSAKQKEDTSQSYTLVKCSSCGTKNRVRTYFQLKGTRCGRCGASLYEDTSSNESWDNRTMCGDGSCVGIIGSDGHCNYCGRTYEEAKKQAEINENLRKNVAFESQRKIKKIFFRKLFFYSLGAIAFIVLIIISSQSPSNKKQYLKPEKIKITKVPLIPVAMPNTGIIEKNFIQGIAPLTLRTKYKDQNYYIKLVRLKDNTEICRLFIKGGDSLSLEIPLGSYEMRCAVGKTWYGEDLRFGPNTVYQKPNDVFHFKIQGNQVLGHTIELFLQLNGNLSMKQITASEF